MAEPCSAPGLPQYAVLDGGFATELVRHGFKEIDVSIPIRFVTWFVRCTVNTLSFSKLTLIVQDSGACPKSHKLRF